MKSAFYYLAAVLMLCSSAFAAPFVRAATSNSGVRVPAQSAITTAEGQLIVGHWEGTLTYGGSEQGISVDISSVGDAYSGTADIPDVGIINIPLRNLAFERSVIQFDLPLGRGRYVGKLQKDTIIGNTGNRWDDEVVVTIAFERKQTPAFPYRQKELRFSNGDVTLVGTLFLPRSPGPHPAVVAVHGATERTRDNPDYRFLADLLPRHGIAVLLYDGRGAGESTGNFNSGSFVDLAQDAIAGVQELSRYPEIDAKHIGLWRIHP